MRLLTAGLTLASGGIMMGAGYALAESKLLLSMALSVAGGAVIALAFFYGQRG